VIATFQAFVLAGPIVGFLLARSICFGLMRRDADALAHGFETGRILRLPGGEYVEVHHPLDLADRERDIGSPELPAVMLRPDDGGRLPRVQILRDRLDRALFRGDAGKPQPEPD
jgi:ubiquinol-cytochrome c reductase cytochrome b subunit